MRKQSEENEEYYIIQFWISGKKYIALWYTSDQDGFVLDEETFKIKIFENEKFAQEFADKHYYHLYNDNTIIPCDKLERISRDEINCDLILTFWNVVSDVAHSLNIYFSGDNKSAEIQDIYAKLFYGCNLPAIKKCAEEFTPRWDASEKNLMIQVIKEGLRIIKEGLAIE